MEKKEVKSKVSKQTENRLTTCASVLTYGITFLEVYKGYAQL